MVRDHERRGVVTRWRENRLNNHHNDDEATASTLKKINVPKWDTVADDTADPATPCMVTSITPPSLPSTSGSSKTTRTWWL